MNQHYPGLYSSSLLLFMYDGISLEGCAHKALVALATVGHLVICIRHFAHPRLSSFLFHNNAFQPPWIQGSLITFFLLESHCFPDDIIRVQCSVTMENFSIPFGDASPNNQRKGLKRRVRLSLPMVSYYHAGQLNNEVLII